jgi:YVTN family beta-propeller protein
MRLIVLIALLAPFFMAPSCIAANQAYFYFWCSKQLDGTTKVYTYVAIQTGSKPSPGPGGDVSAPVQTAISGKDCANVPNDLSPLKAYPLSDPRVKALGIHARPGEPASHDASASTSRQDTFGWLVPLPFDPPVHIPSTATSGSCDGSMSVYMVEHDLGQVEDLTACPLKSVATIATCMEPLEQALTPDGRTLLVTCYDNKVVWIDTLSDQVTFTLDTPNAYPAGIAISPDGTRAYVTNYYNSNPNPALLVIDVVNKTILQTFPLSLSYPGVVALTPDGSQAWVDYYQQNVVDVIDTLTGGLVGRINLFANTQNAIAFNSTGTKAFISVIGANQLAVVDTATLKTLAMVNVGPAPADVIYNPQEQTVLVGSTTQGIVSQVDAVSNTLIQNFTVDNGGIGLSLVLGNLPFPSQ